MVRAAGEPKGAFLTHHSHPATNFAAAQRRQTTSQPTCSPRLFFCFLTRRELPKTNCTWWGGERGRVMRARAANTALFRGALRGRPAGRAHPGPAGARGGDRWIAGSPDRWIPGSPDRAEPTPPAPAHRGPARPGPPAAPSGAVPGPRAQQRLFHPAPPARHVPDRGAGGAARRGSCRRGGDAVTVTGARREGKAASPRGGGAASLPAPSPAAPGRARPALGTSRLPHGPAPAPAALPGGSGHAGRAASIRERARGGAAAGAERAGARREPSPHRGGSQGS